MSGETHLKMLLAAMQPRLDATPYRFVTLPKHAPAAQRLRPLMTFREAEGLTLIVADADAESAEMPDGYRCRRIILTVHSSLAAVGFLAAVTARLAQAGISVNPVSAFHHDHLFVPPECADEALRLLEALAADSR